MLRREVGRTWEEIKALPVNQRRVLMWHLSLEDWMVFLQARACCLQEMAEALEMEWQDFVDVYLLPPAA